MGNLKNRERQITCSTQVNVPNTGSCKLEQKTASTMANITHGSDYKWRTSKVHIKQNQQSHICVALAFADISMGLNMSSYR